MKHEFKYTGTMTEPELAKALDGGDRELVAVGTQSGTVGNLAPGSGGTWLGDAGCGCCGSLAAEKGEAFHVYEVFEVGE